MPENTQKQVLISQHTQDIQRFSVILRAATAAPLLV